MIISILNRNSILIKLVITKGKEMIKIEEKAKVYIVSPYHNTGGPKSLHQLANILIDKGVDTYIVYYCNGKFIREPKILYDFCRAKVTQSVIDNESNTIIVPEIYHELLSSYSKITKVIWWLSLDFYLTTSLWEAVKKSTYRKGLPSFFVPAMLIKYIINDPTCLKKFKGLDDNKLKNYYHMYNCEYEKEYLLNQNVSTTKMSYLCGPLEEKFLDLNFEEIREYKKNIIAYNPAKMDMNFLKKVKNSLKNLNDNIEYVAIENMTREQVFNALKSAKVYIDFGFFPGPERMPREAVSLYCNIITSTEGSAGNDVDVMIPREFKFNIKDKNSVGKVSNLINDMVRDYDNYVKYGDSYREKVRNQITGFSNQIEEIFELNKELED